MKRDIEEIKHGSEIQKYFNYKLTLIESLQILLDKKDENTVYEAKKALKLSKKFHFNQSAKIGENNFYFYILY